MLRAVINPKQGEAESIIRKLVEFDDVNRAGEILLNDVKIFHSIIIWLAPCICHITDI